MLLSVPRSAHRKCILFKSLGASLLPVASFCGRLVARHRRDAPVRKGVWGATGRERWATFAANARQELQRMVAWGIGALSHVGEARYCSRGALQTSRVLSSWHTRGLAKSISPRILAQAAARHRESGHLGTIRAAALPVPEPPPVVAAVAPRPRPMAIHALRHGACDFTSVGGLLVVMLLFALPSPPSSR